MLPYLPPLAVLLILGTLVVWRPLAADSAFRQAADPQLLPAERLAAGLRATELWAREPTYHLALASLEGRLGHFAEAERHLARATRIRPEDPLIWAARGEMYAHWAGTEPERWLLAQAAYERALRLSPNIATYHTALGLILAQQGQTSAGVTHVRRALELDATDVTAYSHLAHLYDRLGQGKKAEWARQEANYWYDQTKSD
jgi:Flp pilus assembly protein TadD